jgi:hypothetical protein
MYPTSTGGRYVAMLSMMMGVLVIAFPVSVFSEPWAEELSDAKGFDHVSNSVDSNNDELNERRKAFDSYAMSSDEREMIYECLDVIREREQRIRSLLSQTTKPRP